MLSRGLGLLHQRGGTTTAWPWRRNPVRLQSLGFAQLVVSGPSPAIRSAAVELHADYQCSIKQHAPSTAPALCRAQRLQALPCPFRDAAHISASSRAADLPGHFGSLCKNPPGKYSASGARQEWNKSSLLEGYKVALALITLLLAERPKLQSLERCHASTGKGLFRQRCRWETRTTSPTSPV